MDVGQRVLRCAALLCMLLLAAAKGLGEPVRPVSGDISFSVSPTRTRTYMSMALPFEVLINASAPLSLGGDALRSSSFTVKGTFGGLSIAAGNLKIGDAAGFLARPDLVSSRGDSLLSSANLGNSSDPLGIALTSSRLSLFLTRDELYTCGGLQYLLFERAVHVIVGLGSLWGEGNQGSVVHRLRPWFSSAVGYRVSNVSFLARAQVYPNLEAAGGDFFDFAWLRAAACRLDISWRAPRQRMMGFLYAEAGDFVSATGKVSSRDALAQIDYVADISWVPFVKHFSLGLSVFSKQGAAETEAGATPSFGTFPDSLALKYWPDGAEGRLGIENKELRGILFRTILIFDSSFSWELVKKPGTWFGKFAFDLNVRSLGVALSSAGPQAAAHQAPAPKLGLEFALQTSCQGQEKASETEGNFGDILEYEAAEDVSSTVQGSAGALTLDRAIGALRVAFGTFSCRTAVEFPLKPSDSDALRIKVRASARVGHLLVEASGTGDFKTAEKQFSIASAHLYVKIPL
jgi:hypothetical protein